MSRAFEHPAPPPCEPAGPVAPGAVARAACRRRFGWLGLWLGGVLVAVSAAVGFIAVVGPTWWDVAGHAEPDERCTAERAMHRATRPPGEPSDSEPGCGPAASASVEQPAGASVPETTRALRRGSVEVVDVGTAEPTLRSALRVQLGLARSRGQTVLLMLTGQHCRPCRGVDEAIGDPRMQVALDGVRLVRVDLDVFREEIDDLGLPRDIYPAFFLLSPDLSPRDTIHGGEWGEDVAENIAPVLGSFVRGTYVHRRYERAPSSRSLRL